MIRFCLVLALALALVLAITAGTDAQCCPNGICPAARAIATPRVTAEVAREVLPDVAAEYARAASILGGQQVVPGYQPATVPTIAPQPRWYIVTPAGLVPMYSEPGSMDQSMYRIYQSMDNRGYDPWINADMYRGYYGPRLVDRLFYSRAMRARAATAGAKAK